ncbi:MAG: LptF/LptG family permease [Desulfocapsaceae bacterium]|jgi:lipopolysaccharide export system permease protein|nr:LptF/LptG family permease [Desulfocapsaceae bacterium]
MQLLTRYLLGQFARYFFTINIGFVAVYLLIDFFEKYDEFAEAGKPASLIVKFFLYNIPFVVDQLGPILILLSGVITLGVLNHSNELTALKAAGIPLKRITRPLFIAALLFTALFILTAQFLLPNTISLTNDIWYEQVRGKVPLGIYRNGRYYFKGSEGFYSFQWPNNKDMILSNFSYSTWDEDYNVKELTVAKFARWTRFGWALRAGQIQTHAGDSFTTEMFGARHFFFPETPEDFLIPEYESVEMSLGELFTDIGKKEVMADRIKARAEFYGRMSYLILGIPLLLLGLPVLILSYQKWGRDLSIAIPVSCGMAFIAWGSWGALQSLAKTGYIPALPAALAVHVVFSLVGMYLLRKQDR